MQPSDYEPGDRRSHAPHRRHLPAAVLLLLGGALAACSSGLDTARCVNNVECGLGVCVAGRCVASDGGGADSAEDADDDALADVAVDTPVDVTVDAPVDTDNPDVAADVAPDVAADVAPDVAPDADPIDAADTELPDASPADADAGPVCEAGVAACDGNVLVTCNAAGTAVASRETCVGGCAEGACLDPCAVSGSYTGCRFFAVDLDNFATPCSIASPCSVGTTCVDGSCEPSAASQPFVLVASNTGTSAATTNVFLSDESDALATARIGPRGVHVFDTLPRADIDGSERSRDSYRVESDVPITLHQFNPGNNAADVYSNDASLVLPTASLGQRYIALGWPGLADAGGTVFARASVTVVATSPGSTVISIVSPVATAPGARAEPPALRPNVSETFTLEQGEVLALAALTGAGDLTGLEVDASQAVAVFSGSECANIPTGVGYCDHVEQQLLPLDSWGTVHVGARFSPRGTAPDVWRVVAGADGTVLTVSPTDAAPGISGRTLNRGALLEFRSRGDFVLTSTAPVSLGQFMVGSSYPTDNSGTCSRNVLFGDTNCAIPASCDSGSGIGDPAFTLTIPSARFTDNYVVLTPETYSQDFLNVVAPTGTNVTIDGVALTSSPTTVGAWNVWREPVEDGAHRVVGDRPFGLTAYGYDCDVSYAYPGGMNLGPR